ncbi:TadE/TadG family type IV pilus assembly protein [Pseudonocardia sp. GCM10023141]|uniref:TadE/TadG family type IV pilus assembly protein n=1 Tax=Pseudonocardia sp. GCM10023141 TaxID=3252653 RepID=UPI00360E5D55
MRAEERERGGAVGVQMALLWPVLLLLILAVVQVSLIFYAGQLALTAAEDGVRAGRSYGQPQPDQAARQSATAFLTKAAGNTLTTTDIDTKVDNTTVRVTVSGDAPALVPGIRIRVTREAVGGLERITP